MSKKNVFILSIVAGFVCWAVFDWFNAEPWDSLYGIIVIAFLGLCLGFIGKESPWLWPLGIFLGEIIFGLGSLMKDSFFYNGGGANLFIPLGIFFLIPFSLPAFIGSFIGFGIRKATVSTSNK